MWQYYRKDFDIVTVYDCDDPNCIVRKQIRILSGLYITDQTVISTKGYILVHFRSDDKNTDSGWKAKWVSVAKGPAPIKIPPPMTSPQPSLVSSFILRCMIWIISAHFAQQKFADINRVLLICSYTFVILSTGQAAVPRMRCIMRVADERKRQYHGRVRSQQLWKLVKLCMDHRT